MNRTLALKSALLALGITLTSAWAGPPNAHHDHHHGAQQTPHAHTPPEQARNLQQAHRFSEAAIILEDYLRTAPRDSEALLLHADVLRHAEQFEASRGACARVALTGASTLAGYCAAQILIDTEDYTRADEICNKLAPQIAYLQNNAQVWALEISAEAAWRSGNRKKAKRLFEQALAFDEVPHSTLDAYAAFLRVTR